MFTGDAALVALIDNSTALIAAGKYGEVAEAYEKFVADHPTTAYMASEPVPFKINAYLSKKYGSSATTTYTLRHSTWASDVKKALKAGPVEFSTLLEQIDSAVAEIAKGVKPLN